MNVAQLIAELEKVEFKDAEVILASDPEGNRMHPLLDVSLDLLDEDGEFIDLEDPANQDDQGACFGVDVVSLWP